MRLFTLTVPWRMEETECCKLSSAATQFLKDGGIEAKVLVLDGGSELTEVPTEETPSMIDIGDLRDVA